LPDLARQTARLWRKHHFTYNQTTYDQTKHVAEQGCRELRLEAPPNGRSALLCRNFGLRYLKASFKELGTKLLPVCNVLLQQLTTRGIALVEEGRCEESVRAQTGS